ncbi:MAG: hypothetical protein WC349_02610 [Patescibacteria group bacterium]|jgi:hypothetical protein
MVTKSILWAMMGCQMVAWAYFSFRGGTLSNYHFYIFSLGMMTGQIGAAIETWIQKSYGTLMVQVYFFVFTFIGLINRISQ